MDNKQQENFSLLGNQAESFKNIQNRQIDLSHLYNPSFKNQITIIDSCFDIFQVPALISSDEILKD